MNTVAKIEPKEMTAQAVSETSSIVLMIERAARDPSVDIDKMERLLLMQERVIARDAKAAYDRALAMMQPKLPDITERGKIKVGTEVRSTYAKWEDINAAIKPVLAEHGFAISHRITHREGKILITGVLSHQDGHREETTIELPHDNSGSKNAVQAVGSSTSYGQRYTAKLLLNLTSRGEDDDGNAAGEGDTISDEQVKEISDLLTTTKSNLVLFLKTIKLESLTQIRASKFDDAVKLIKSTAEKRAAREKGQPQ